MRRTAPGPGGWVVVVRRLGVVVMMAAGLGSAQAAGRSGGTGAPGAGMAAAGAMNSGEVSVIRIAARKAGLENFRLQSRTGPSGRIIVEGFSATLGGGRVTGTGHVDFARPSGPHRMRVELSGVDAMAFLRLLEVKLDATVQTRVDGVFDLEWRGTTGAQARRTLSGTVRWTAGEGHVSGADVMKQAARLTGIAALSGFSLLSAEAAGVFRDGVLSVESLYVSGPHQEVTGSGRLDAITRDIQMALRIRVAPELLDTSTRPEVRALGLLAKGTRNAKGGGQAAADKMLTIPVPLTMTGKVQDPRFHFGTFGAPDAGAHAPQGPASPERRQNQD